MGRTSAEVATLVGTETRMGTRILDPRAVRLVRRTALAILGSGKVPMDRARRGVALPLVAVALLIFVSLGLAFLQTSETGYRMTALSAYRLRLHELLVSGLEEARLRLFEATSRLGDGSGQGLADPELRRQLLDAIGTAGGDVSGVELEVDLVPMLPNTGFLAQQDGTDTELILAKAKFYGLRPVVYSQSTEFGKKVEYYYSNLEPFKDEPTLPADYLGYCTVSVVAKHRGVTRSISVTHDIKVVDATPPAREFSLFAWRNTLDDPERMYRALSEGNGKLAIYSNAVGRQFVRGPYFMPIEGRADGLGGVSPTLGPSHPDSQRKWYGWSQLPAPRALFGQWGRVGADDPVQPSQACCNRCSFSGTTGPGVGLTASTDPAGFGASQPYFCPTVNAGGQKFLPMGEPDKLGTPMLGPSTWRGLLRHQVTEGEGENATSYYQALEWKPLEADTWDTRETGDRIDIEGSSGSTALWGLWTPVKAYAFKGGERCSEDGFLAGVGAGVVSFGGDVLNTVGFGAVELNSYHREPDRSEEGIAGPDTPDKLKEVAKGPMGKEYSDVEKAESSISVQPYGFWYEKKETQSFWGAIFRVGFNVLSAALMIPTAGAGGLLARGAGKIGAAKVATVLATRGGQVATGVAGTIAADRGITGVTRLLADGLQVTETPSFEEIVLKSDWATKAAQATAPGERALNLVMTGIKDGDANPAALEEWWAAEPDESPDKEGQENPATTQGFLPPGLKPYLRLSSVVYKDLPSALPGADKPLSIEGVVTVEKLPQQEDAFTQDLTYRGRGILFSAASARPDEPNKAPVFGGNLTRAGNGTGAAADHLTLVYWNNSEIPSTHARDGLGFLTFSKEKYEASVVSRFGVRPGTEHTRILGNLVCATLDRHRFDDNKNLRVYYNYEVLAPDKVETGGTPQPMDPGSFTAVAVSPKVAGWFEAAE